MKSNRTVNTEHVLYTSGMDCGPLASTDLMVLKRFGRLSIDVSTHYVPEFETFHFKYFFHYKSTYLNCATFKLICILRNLILRWVCWHFILY